MATSNGVLDYLSSPKNLVGLGVAIAATAVAIPTGLAGQLWPIVTAASYGLGAVLTPRRRTRLKDLQLDRVYSAEELSDALEEDSSLAPKELRAEVEAVIGPMRDVLARWEKVQTSSQVSMDVTSLVLDYLPTTLTAYAALPPYLQHSKRDVVRRQLGILQEYAQQARDAVFADDVRALEAQGAFLAQKTKGSSLDL